MCTSQHDLAGLADLKSFCYDLYEMICVFVYEVCFGISSEYSVLYKLAFLEETCCGRICKVSNLTRSRC